jgi:hypothetical protein
MRAIDKVTLCSLDAFFATGFSTRSARSHLTTVCAKFGLALSAFLRFHFVLRAFVTVQDLVAFAAMFLFGKVMVLVAEYALDQPLLCFLPLIRFFFARCAFLHSPIILSVVCIFGKRNLWFIDRMIVRHVCGKRPPSKL